MFEVEGEAQQVPQARLASMGVTNPLLVPTGVNAMRYLHANTASQVEVYYSGGLLGRTAGGFGAPLVDSGANNIFNGEVFPGTPLPLNIDHTRLANGESVEVSMPKLSGYSL